MQLLELEWETVLAMYPISYLTGSFLIVSCTPAPCVNSNPERESIVSARRMFTYCQIGHLLFEDWIDKEERAAERYSWALATIEEEKLIAPAACIVLQLLTLIHTKGSSWLCLVFWLSSPRVGIRSSSYFAITLTSKSPTWFGLSPRSVRPLIGSVLIRLPMTVIATRLSTFKCELSQLEGLGQRYTLVRRN